MLRSTEVLTNGLNDLEDLERGRYQGKNRKVKPNIAKIKIDFSRLEVLEKSKFFRNPNDDDMDSEFDEIIIPEQDDLIGQKEINISGNVSLINSFPNALLLEESIFKRPEKVSKKPPKKSPKKNNAKKTKPGDIWDVLNQIKKENNSEALDTLTTEENYSNRICRACHSKGTLVEDQQSSAIVCSKCAVINDELLDQGPEWRQYNNDDNRNEGVGRCGCPSNYFFPKQSQGTIMAGTSNIRLKRKQKWNSMVYKERSLNSVFKEISSICSKNNIPKNIVDSAEYLYKRLSDCSHKTGNNAGKQIIIRGDNRLSIIAACVFKACDLNRNPRTVREIAGFFGLEEKKVTKGIKQYDKLIKNADDRTNPVLDHFNPHTAEDYIRRHCPKLKISKNDMDLAVKISQNCSKMKLASDHNPQSIAAGSILVMVKYCNLSVDKKDIAELFGTSDVTIGKIYNKIVPFVDALVDDDATEHLIKKFRVNG